MPTSPECLQTFDGKHHWAKRHWLAKPGGRGTLPAYDPAEKGHWSWVWACVCEERPPDALIPQLKELAKEADRIRRVKFGQEEHEEPRMEGL